MKKKVIIALIDKEVLILISKEYNVIIKYMKSQV